MEPPILDDISQHATDTESSAEGAEHTESAEHTDNARPTARAAPWLRSHGLFLAALVLAAALRTVVTLGYRWQMWFNDSYLYVKIANNLHHSGIRPAGYAFMLRVLKPLHSFATVAALQHLMGLTIGVLCYALARRHGVRGWVATLAAVPVLFDVHQVQLEHVIMSDVPFTLLVIAALTLVLWRPPVKSSGWLAGVAGLLLGVAGVTRSVGLPLLGCFVLCLLVGRAGWRPLVALVIGAALPLAGYVTWHHSTTAGTYSATSFGGVFLYSRTMKFADCAKMHPPANLRSLCVSTPADKRHISQWYIWDPDAPLQKAPGGPWTSKNNARARKFAYLAIRTQPLDYLRVGLDDTLRPFSWHRVVYPNPDTYYQYEFGRTAHSRPSKYLPDIHAYERGHTNTHIVEPYAGLVRAYQRYVYMRGLLLGAILLVGAAGLIARWRRIGGAGLLPWLLAAALIVEPAFTADFSYRYLLPAAPLACVALALVARRPRDDPR